MGKRKRKFSQGLEMSIINTRSTMLFITYIYARRSSHVNEWLTFL